MSLLAVNWTAVVAVVALVVAVLGLGVAFFCLFFLLRVLNRQVKAAQDPTPDDDHET